MPVVPSQSCVEGVCAGDHERETETVRDRRQIDQIEPDQMNQMFQE